MIQSYKKVKSLFWDSQWLAINHTSSIWSDEIWIKLLQFEYQQIFIKHFTCSYTELSPHKGLFLRGFILFVLFWFLRQSVNLCSTAVLKNAALVVLPDQQRREETREKKETQLTLRHSMDVHFKHTLNSLMNLCCFIVEYKPCSMAQPANPVDSCLLTNMTLL